MHEHSPALKNTVPGTSGYFFKTCTLKQPKYPLRFQRWRGIGLLLRADWVGRNQVLPIIPALNFKRSL